MNPNTHAVLGWAVAQAGASRRRDQATVTLAALAPDLDGAGGGLRRGPLWDFDIAWGDANCCEGWEIAGFVWSGQDACGDLEEVPLWWHVVMADPTFTRALRCR